MKNYIEYKLLMFLLFVVKKISITSLYKLMEKISLLIYKYEKRRKKITLSNLKIAFPNKTQKEIEELSIEAYISLSKTITEILLLFTNRLNIFDYIEDIEVFRLDFDKIKKENKNGIIIIITGHYSNWEMLAQLMPQIGFPMIGIGREGNNKLIEKNYTTPFREMNGNKNIYKNQAMSKIIKGLKNNEIIGLLIDQKQTDKNSILSKLFNKKAPTTNSIALLKLKYNPKIVSIFIERNQKGKYRIKMESNIGYNISNKTSKKDSIQIITDKHNNIIESQVKLKPEQWFWMHNRWNLK